MKKSISIVGIFILLVSMSSQTGIPRAQAMFIYNFSRLIEWPPNYRTGQFVIGVIGSSSTFNELKTYTVNKTVGSQQIVVKKYSDVSEIGKCQILFVPFGKTKLLPQITDKIASNSTLIVSEKNGAINNGSTINFVIVGDKLKFEIKPDNATSRGIKLSSKLNEMAYKNY